MNGIKKLRSSNGNPDLDKIRPYAFCIREYRQVAGRLGSFGFSKEK